MHYENKIRLFSQYNNYKKCALCLDDNLNIMLNCGHEICIECYRPNLKCYLNFCN